MCPSRTDRTAAAAALGSGRESLWGRRGTWEDAGQSTEVDVFDWRVRKEVGSADKKTSWTLFAFSFSFFFFCLSQLLAAAVADNNHLFLHSRNIWIFFFLCETAGLRSVCVHLPVNIYAFIYFHGWQVRSSSRTQAMWFISAASCM